MADTKISALPASTTPLAGTEVLPIVQSSSTKQVSVANLTAGRAISATQLTLTTGNVIVASGQGVDFSATSHPAGMTSELLADYEEGTWTPAQGSGLTVVGVFSSSGTYTKIGRQVTVIFSVAGATTIAITAAGIITNNLPFTASSGADKPGTIYRFGASGGECIAGSTTTEVYNGAAIVAGGGVQISITYFV